MCHFTFNIEVNRFESAAVEFSYFPFYFSFGFDLFFAADVGINSVISGILSEHQCLCRVSTGEYTCVISFHLCLVFARSEVLSVSCCRMEGLWEWEASSLCQSVASRDMSKCLIEFNAVKAKLRSWLC